VYPGTWAEFLAWFPDEAACARYLGRLRWPEGIVCRACGEERGWWIGECRLWVCAGCGRKTSVTAGTIFDKTRVPLQSWFAATWFVTSQKHGLSALGLQRALGLGSYQTAWMMLHRLRVAMVRPERERLSGRVEVDETYVGGEEEGVQGRETQDKSIIAIAVEVRQPTGVRARPACPRARRVGLEPDSVRRGERRAGQRGAHRWLERLPPPGRPRLHAYQDDPVGER
jgi:hypothetical protein